MQTALSGFTPQCPGTSPSAVNKDADAWYVEGEKEYLYAIVYFSQKKRYGGKSMPKCEILQDWDSVVQRFAADHKESMSKLS